MKKLTIKDIMDKASAEVEAERKEMHPEDRKMMKEGKEYAKKYAAKFCIENIEELIETISAYEDGRAEDIWDGLREKFWVRDWEYEGK